MPSSGSLVPPAAAAAAAAVLIHSTLRCTQAYSQQACTASLLTIAPQPLDEGTANLLSQSVGHSYSPQHAPTRLHVGLADSYVCSVAYKLALQVLREPHQSASEKPALVGLTSACVQAAIHSNTQALVQRNIAAGVMCMSQRRTPDAVVFSPCGQLVAWLKRGRDKTTLKVENRCTGQQIFSQPLPCPRKHLSAWARSRMRDICWSHDSNFLAISYVRGLFAADLVSGLMKRLYRPVDSFAEQCYWAPSANLLAILQSPSVTERLMSLYQVSDSELQMVHQVTRPFFWHARWTADSQVLAMQGDDICILDTGNHHQLEIPFHIVNGANSAVVWSPSSWEHALLLCISATSGEVLFFDCKAALKGRSEHPVHTLQADDIFWGEHGVIFLTQSSLGLFDVRCGSNGLLLAARRTMSMSVHSPAMSPDQVHVCVVQSTPVSSAKHKHSLVILNVVSGIQALITLPGHTSREAMPSWTRSGFSLAVPLVVSRRLGADKYIYNVFGFVI